jgi:hypothetical protein
MAVIMELIMNGSANGNKGVKKRACNTDVDKAMKRF